jgi:hypothetical protein
VHAVDPVRIEAGDSIDDVTHGILVGEDPNNGLRASWRRASVAHRLIEPPACALGHRQ